MKTAVWSLPLFTLLFLPPAGGCGGGSDPVTPTDTVPSDTIPLDGRGGGVIAYTSQPESSGGLHQIHVMNGDGTASEILISASIGLNHHDWSPNAVQLAAVGYYGQTWSVHTVNADGTNLTRLTDTEGVWDNEPTWSPDGTRLTFSRTYPDDGFRSELWTMNADGTDAQFIGVEGFQPRWSVDGYRLIFQSRLSELAGGQSDIMTCGADGSNLQAVTDTPENEFAPIWSPDGTRIAFASDEDGDFDLFVMNGDGTGIQRLTENSVDDFAPRWSPNGALIAFTSDSSGSQHWEVYVIGSDGSNGRRVTYTTPPNTAINPVWRPVVGGG